MSKHILSSCTTLPLCITLHSIPSCENVITPFCENVITGSNLNRNKDPHESSTSPRSNKTGHKQTDYFLFCCDPLHVIFQLTWKNESKVAVVTWRAGNTRAISSETRSRWTSLFLLLWDLAGIPARGEGEEEEFLWNMWQEDQFWRITHMLVLVNIKEKVLYVIPNQCNTCDFASSFVNNLRAPRHTGEKPF